MMDNSSVQEILLIGHGAIAAEVHNAAKETGLFRISTVLVLPQRVRDVQAELPGIRVIGKLDDLDIKPVCAVECASHSAVRSYGPALLRRGIDFIIASTGALSDDLLHAELRAAAQSGNAKLILAAGAVPGIDALNAALVGGLSSVCYTSRKPPSAWLGTPAEQTVKLEGLTEPVVHYAGDARSAARDYPKNANVASTIALAGLGFEGTEVCMIADPFVRENIHEISARGAFGEMHITIKGKPLAHNPRTSSLTAYSVVRAVLNCVGREVFS